MGQGEWLKSERLAGMIRVEFEFYSKYDGK